MNPLEYRTALTTLGLSQLAAGRWLRVSPKTAQNYAKHGPSGPAAVAVEMRLAFEGVDRFENRHDGGMFSVEDGPYVLHDDLIAALKGEVG